MPASSAPNPADSAAPAARKPGRPRKTAAAAASAEPAAPAAKAAAKNPAQQALVKLGLVRDIDLALHLPLRYEDETRITPLRNARDGEVAQIEATVVSSEIQMRPRRQLVVRVEDADGVMLQASNMIRDSIKPDVTMFVNYAHEQIEQKDIIKIKRRGACR